MDPRLAIPMVKVGRMSRPVPELATSSPLPMRSEKRSFPLMIRWFEQQWSHIEAFLPLVQLLDVNLEEINFARERAETMCRKQA
jgi:hypothetical protein